MLTRRDDKEVPPKFLDEEGVRGIGGSRGGMGVNLLKMRFGMRGDRGPRSGGYDDFDEYE